MSSICINSESKWIYLNNNGSITYKEDGVEKAISKSELIKIKNFILKTEEIYNLNNINDEVIDRVNFNRYKIKQNIILKKRIERKKQREVLIKESWKIKQEKRESEENKTAVIYLLKNGDITKIGVTLNLKNRMRAYKTALPKAELIYWFNEKWKTEDALHKYFESKHDAGEWYFLDEDDICWIKKTYQKRFTDKPIKNFII